MRRFLHFLQEAATSDDDDDEDLPEDVTFAPKDVTPISFTPKDNVHGIGYTALDPHVTLGHVTLFDAEPIRQRKGHKGFTGQVSNYLVARLRFQFV